VRVCACVRRPTGTYVGACDRARLVCFWLCGRASAYACVRVCACVCTRVRLSTCKGACVHARELALVCAFVHMRARACVADRLALRFPWQARARHVAAEVKARPESAARRALARAPTAPARAATARAHVARAFLRAHVHCWAALFLVSRGAFDAPICFKIGDCFIKFYFFYFRVFSGIYFSVVLIRRHSLPRRALHLRACCRRTRRRRLPAAPPRSSAGSVRACMHACGRWFTRACVRRHDHSC
jgi:hypothetical protein